MVDLMLAGLDRANWQVRVTAEIKDLLKRNKSLKDQVNWEALYEQVSDPRQVVVALLFEKRSATGLADAATILTHAVLVPQDWHTVVTDWRVRQRSGQKLIIEFWSVWKDDATSILDRLKV